MTALRLLAGVTAAALCVAGGQARAQAASEEAVKAAFITKFPTFVVWSGSPARPVICTVGEDPVVLSLAGAGVRDAELRRLDSVSGGSGCTVAYVAGSSRQTVGQALQALEGSRVLTITDARRSTVRGIIHFTVQRQRVRFFIDLGRAQRSGLAVSSKLLALAAGVTR